MYIKIILLILFFLNYSSKIIVIPFRILEKYELINNKHDPYSFFENNTESPIYTNILLGEPPKNITTIISFNTYEMSISHLFNNTIFNKTLYQRNISKTFEKFNYKSKNRQVNYFKEQAIFYTDLDFKNTIKAQNLLFCFIEGDKNKKQKNDSSLYITIGFQLSDFSDNKIFKKDINNNIIFQLKEKNYISSYSFNIHFQLFEINKEIFNGFIVIGNEPHQYLKRSYNEYQLLKTLAYKKDKELSWDIHFNKIYYLRANNYQKIINENSDFYNQASLFPESSLIIGTLDYEQNIRYDFFNNLIFKRKCIKETINFMIFYYCYKNLIEKNDLENFPILYFSNIELNYEFELTYEDLFFEKDELLYFLIIFYDYPDEVQNYFFSYISRWEFGTPFLKKYFFTYDYDGKYIGFYNSKKLIKKNLGKNSNNKIILLIISISILSLGFIGIFYVRKYILKNKRFNAIELKYNDINNINEEKDNYYNIEMRQKII